MDSIFKRLGKLGLVPVRRQPQFGRGDRDVVEFDRSQHGSHDDFNQHRRRLHCRDSIDRDRR